MNAYDITRIIRPCMDGSGFPYRHTPETGTFAFAVNDRWAVILQPFGSNIEFSCWCREGFNLMSVVRLTEYAEKLNAAFTGGKFSVRGHETDQGKLQLSFRAVRAVSDDFSGEIFGAMLAEVCAVLEKADKNLTAVADGSLAPADAV
ncbi:MAG: hypothetical protein IKM31_03625 [Oscillospiraceae bacterium]|nr:hypothetical protein [Oscillospiraceae bacterium]